LKGRVIYKWRTGKKIERIPERITDLELPWGEGVRKTMRKFSQGIRCLDRQSNLALPG
jgi:hypothetical protein